MQGFADKGIIPACAGNTLLLEHIGAKFRDHPRVCGEHITATEDDHIIPGSSPRVRGTPDAVCRELRGGGIIPACAGNTRPEWRRQAGSRDHPRVCGEHDSAGSVSTGSLGSSPRVRGTPLDRVEDVADRGIIPACAGNTLPMPWRGRLWRDHPRVCGEHRQVVRHRHDALGSSPRVRGTRSSDSAQPLRVGIIPACAGNTILLVREVERERDHPRVCGEHDEGRADIKKPSGSSPRVRGTLLLFIDGLRFAGIIPACAGNTLRK